MRPDAPVFASATMTPGLGIPPTLVSLGQRTRSVSSMFPRRPSAPTSAVAVQGCERQHRA